MSCHLLIVINISVYFHTVQFCWCSPLSIQDCVTAMLFYRNMWKPWFRHSARPKSTSVRTLCMHALMLVFGCCHHSCLTLLRNCISDCLAALSHQASSLHLIHSPVMYDDIFSFVIHLPVIFMGLEALCCGLSVVCACAHDCMHVCQLAVDFWFHESLCQHTDAGD